MTGRFVARRFPVIALVGLSTGTSTLAQVPDEQEVGQMVPMMNPNAWLLDESNFNQWVFGNFGRVANVNRQATNPSEAARDQLNSALISNIGEIERSCPLSESQKQKLLLAGHGDIKRFLDRVADARRVYEELKHDPNSMNTIHQETIPLAASLNAGIFGSDSFFFKTIGSTLDPDQAVRYRNAILDRIRFRHEAKLRLAIANLDNTLGLTDDQRQRLIRLAIEETKPSRKPAGQYENQVVLLKLARLPEATLRPIFDDKQWRLMNQLFQQPRALETFLKASGYLDEP